MKKKFVVAANWKSYLDSTESSRLLAKLDGVTDATYVEHIVCPSLISLSQRKCSPQKWSFGVQDLFWDGHGAYTGEPHIKDVKKLKAKYAIVGHSERRVYLGETDTTVSMKAMFARENKITPIICIGENMKQHKDGTTTTVLRRQLQSVVAPLMQHGSETIYIAYEPIWAIKGFGTGKKVKAKELAETIAFLRSYLDKYEHVRYKLLYGGSVDAQLAPQYMNVSIDGFLIGSASTKYASLKDLLKSIYSRI